MTIEQPLRIACHSMAKIFGTTVIYRRCLTQYELEYVEYIYVVLNPAAKA